MEDDASRRSKIYRRLQTSSHASQAGQDEPQRSDGGWFTDASGASTPDAGAEAAEPSFEQRYAQAVAGLNQIVSTGDFTLLPQVTQVLRATVSAMSDSDPARAGVLNNLGSAAQLMFVRSGDLDELRDAVWYFRTATASASGDDPDLLLYRCNLTLSLTDLAERRNSPEDAAEAAWNARTAAEQVTADDPRRLTVLTRLGAALTLHARLAGEPASNDEAIETYRDAVRSSLRQDAARGSAADADLMINLGVALLKRYEREASAGDLDESIVHLRNGAGCLEDDEPRRTALCDLADALRLRFRHTGELSDLVASINELLGVISVLDPGHPLLGRALWYLTCTAAEHIDSTGESRQVHRALRAAMPVARTMTTSDPYRSAAFAGLGALLRRHFQHGGETAALDSAVAAGEAAVEAAADSVTRCTVLSSLTTTLIARYEYSLGLDDLERAAALADEIAENAPEGSTALYTAWTQQAVVSVYYYDHSHKQSDLETALALFEQTLEHLPDDAAERPAIASHLGRALQTMFERTGRRKLYRWARRVLAEAADNHAAPAVDRLEAASLAGRVAAQAYRWSEALESFTTAVKLLPLVTRGKRVVAASEAHDRWAALGADGAACAVECGQPERAVELLEHTRTALLADFLPASGELGELHQQHPEISAEAVRLRRLLDRPAEEPLFSGLDVVSDRERRRQLADSWDTVVNNVRAYTGHEHHLRVLRFDLLSGVADEGSVVLVNISRYRCDALIVFAGRVLMTQLPAAELESTVTRAENLLTAATENDTQLTADILDWLWHSIVRPVLERMGYLGTPRDGERWPRMWWCAAGAASYMPLHAATARTGESALDRVVSSYTPTLQTLMRAKQHDPVPEGRGAAMIAAGSAESVARTRELPPQNQVLARYWPGARILPEEETSPADFLQLMRSHCWVHVCELSTQFPGQPASGLVLDRTPGESLGVVELGLSTVDNVEFVYLGRCDTGEGIPAPAAQPLAATMGFAGIQHVIAGLWHLDEHLAAQVQKTVYAELSAGGDFTPARSAYALHTAARQARLQYPANVIWWACHTHVGP